MSKAAATDEIIHIWDVTRRTAEFFDDQNGKLRQFALTVSATLLGIGIQFNIWFLFPTILILEFFFWTIDRRYQHYLTAVSKYAVSLEEQYNLGGDGLTHAINSGTVRIRKKKQISLSQVLLGQYYVFMVISIGWILYQVVRFILQLHLQIVI